MILGLDCSSLRETQADGAKYFVHGKEIDPLAYLHDENGLSLLRLRVWVDPYDENGNPYGGGTCDLANFISLAKEGIEKGYQILLDLHYSDFWCDPSKQFIPKSWQKLSKTELISKVEEYTRETLLTIKKEGISLYGIQIGNEITGGMLWPIGKLTGGENGGKRDNYDTLVSLLKAGIKPTREIYPKAKIMIHLERSYDQKVYLEYFDELVSNNVDFDIIGMSYYPEWHGSFDMVFANVELMKKTYKKPIWIVELAYNFTEELAYEASKDALKENFPFPLDYPFTQDGQKDYIEALISRCKEHGVEGLVYWEPLWIAMPHLSWASKAGEAYTGETDKPTANEWAAKCLFDFRGEATKALFSFKE